MGVVRHLSRFTELRRAVGPGKAIWITPLWAVAKRYVVIGRELSDLEDFQIQPSDYSRHGLESSSPAELASFDRRLDVTEIQRRVAEGQTCEIWRRDDEIVHFRWYSDVRTALPFLGVEFKPIDGDYLLFEVYTLAANRVRGVHSSVATRSLMRSKEDGHQRTVAICGWWNTPALRVGEKYGFERLGTVTRWQLGPWVRFTSTGQVKVKGKVLSVPRSRSGEGVQSQGGGADPIGRTGEA